MHINYFSVALLALTVALCWRILASHRRDQERKRQEAAISYEVSRTERKATPPHGVALTWQQANAPLPRDAEDGGAVELEAA